MVTLNFQREVLKKCVGVICQTIGFQGIYSVPLEVLADILQHYIREIAVSARRFAEHNNRTMPMLEDLRYALHEMNVSLPEIEEYMNCVENAPFPDNVPKFPVPRPSELNLLKPGSREILSRPIHIHEHLPPMILEKEDGNGKDLSSLSETASVNGLPSPCDQTEGDNMSSLVNGIGSPSSPGLSNGFSGGKRKYDGELSASKKFRLDGEGQPVREIDSVMMTTSGFISAAREGKLPEARLPDIPLPVVQHLAPSSRSSGTSGNSRSSANSSSNRAAQVLANAAAKKKLSLERLMRHKQNMLMKKKQANSAAMSANGMPSASVSGGRSNKSKKSLSHSAVLSLAAAAVASGQPNVDSSLCFTTKHGKAKEKFKPKIPSAPPGTRVLNREMQQHFINATCALQPPKLKIPTPKPAEFAGDVLSLPKEDILMLKKEDKQKQLAQANLLSALPDIAPASFDVSSGHVPVVAFEETPAQTKSKLPHDGRTSTEKKVKDSKKETKRNKDDKKDKDKKEGKKDRVTKKKDEKDKEKKERKEKKDKDGKKSKDSSKKDKDCSKTKEKESKKTKDGKNKNKESSKKERKTKTKKNADAAEKHNDSGSVLSVPDLTQSVLSNSSDEGALISDFRNPVHSAFALPTSPDAADKSKLSIFKKSNKTLQKDDSAKKLLNETVLQHSFNSNLMNTSAELPVVSSQCEIQFPGVSSQKPSKRKRRKIDDASTSVSQTLGSPLPKKKKRDKSDVEPRNQSSAVTHSKLDIADDNAIPFLSTTPISCVWGGRPLTPGSSEYPQPLGIPNYHPISSLLAGPPFGHLPLPPMSVLSSPVLESFVPVLGELPDRPSTPGSNFLASTPATVSNSMAFRGPAAAHADAGGSNLPMIIDSLPAMVPQSASDSEKKKRDKDHRREKKDKEKIKKKKDKKDKGGKVEKFEKKLLKDKQKKERKKKKVLADDGTTAEIVAVPDVAPATTKIRQPRGQTRAVAARSPQSSSKKKTQNKSDYSASLVPAPGSTAQTQSVDATLDNSLFASSDPDIEIIGQKSTSGHFAFVPGVKSRKNGAGTVKVPMKPQLQVTDVPTSCIPAMIAGAVVASVNKDKTRTCAGNQGKCVVTPNVVASLPSFRAGTLDVGASLALLQLAAIEGTSKANLPLQGLTIPSTLMLASATTHSVANTSVIASKGRSRKQPFPKQQPVPRTTMLGVIKRSEPSNLSSFSVATNSGADHILNSGHRQVLDDQPGSPEIAKISALITRPPKNSSKEKDRCGKSGPPSLGVAGPPVTDVASLQSLNIKEVKSPVREPTYFDSSVVPPIKIKSSSKSSDVPSSKKPTVPIVFGSTSPVRASGKQDTKKAVSTPSSVVTSPVISPPVSFGSSVAPPPAASSTTATHFVDDQGNEIWLCPKCGRQDDGSPMIGCDLCDDWYHWVCVNIHVEPNPDDNWYCPRCVVQQRTNLGGPKKDKKKHHHHHHRKKK